LAKAGFLNFSQTIVSFREFIKNIPDYERTTRSTKNQREWKWGEEVIFPRHETTR
jgi:hypothetical protein